MKRGRALFFGVFPGVLLAACGGNAGQRSDLGPLDAAGARDIAVAAVDMTASPDLAVAVDLGPEPDFADSPADLAEPPDLTRIRDLAGTNGCQSDRDCRLFSDQCAHPTPCTCLPLLAKEPDPVCMGPRVLCLVDPCVGKKAVCELGVCAVR